MSRVGLQMDRHVGHSGERTVPDALLGVCALAVAIAADVVKLSGDQLGKRDIKLAFNSSTGMVGEA